MEECPARFMPGALAQLERLTAEVLREARLDFGEIRVFGTPRRLSVIVSGLAEKQQDLSVEVKGPPRQAAFDASGAPTPAAIGFARKQGVPVESLEVRETDQGAYVYARREEKGLPAPDVLRRVLPELIQRISFPKTMRWGSVSTRFVRPIRWIVALFDEDVIPFEIANVASGNESRGHRFLGPGRVVIPHPGRYVETLRAAGVIVDPQERRQRIAEQVARCAADEGARAWEDDELLEEVTFLVEHPTALVGAFDPSYTELPVEVLVTTMKQHQRYFPLVDFEGAPVARFVAVRDGGDADLDVVRAGNEKVLAARLADARFFFEEDQRRRLAERVEGLKDILFQESLGSMFEKVERILRLTRFLGERLGVSADELATALRAAELSKCDLLTHMVYEFPELQGIMGREYALRDGESPAVAQAIDEHYAPRFSGDAVPRSVAGSLVSLADRFDTLAGCFAVGLIPSGSHDPYSLRRHTLGILHILWEREWELLIGEAIDFALEAIAQRVPVSEDVAENLREFFAGRMRGLLIERGDRADLVDAVLARAFRSVPDVLRRLETLRVALEDGRLSELARTYERAANLADKAEVDAQVQVQLLRTEAERSLLAALERAENAAEQQLRSGAYGELVETLCTLAGPVDVFFAEVLVMDPDPDVRRNRLALLRRVANVLGSLADLRKIHVE